MIPNKEIKEDEESYENGLEVKYNSSEAFAGQRERQLRLEEERGICGKIKRGILAIMRFLLASEPILQAFCVIVATAGSYFSALKAGIDPDTGFLEACVVGSVVFSFLFVIWWATYRYGVFVDKESRKRIRNELSCCTWSAYFITIVLFIVSCYMLYEIRTYCPKHVACDLKGVFIPDNSTLSVYLLKDP